MAAHRAALEEWTRDRVPLDWAKAQNNLGLALETLGSRESGTARLEEAVAVYRAALEEWTRDRVPLQWATTQNNLGAVLKTLGSRESGTARLEEAVAVYRAALEETTRDRAPLPLGGNAEQPHAAAVAFVAAAGGAARFRLIRLFERIGGWSSNRRMGWDWFEALTARLPLPSPRITHPCTPRAAPCG